MFRSFAQHSMKAIHWRPPHISRRKNPRDRRPPLRPASPRTDRVNQSGIRTCGNNICDVTMYHMNNASVRDLRYRFSEVEDLLRQGQEIQITKRRRVIATLVPAPPARAGRRPDFLARLREAYGTKVLKTSGTELLAAERTRH
jgi:antitoxin (DNA-binding transcriptional repressor) of toxin-antitoxin stability system